MMKKFFGYIVYLVAAYLGMIFFILLLKGVKNAIINKWSDTYEFTYNITSLILPVVFLISIGYLFKWGAKLAGHLKTKEKTNINDIGKE